MRASMRWISGFSPRSKNMPLLVRSGLSSSPPVAVCTVSERASRGRRRGLAARLSDILAYGAGWNDAVLLACALRGESLAELADLARALAGSAERLRETEEQGAAFARARDFGGLSLLELVLDPQALSTGATLDQTRAMGEASQRRA